MFHSDDINLGVNGGDEKGNQGPHIKRLRA